MTNLEVFLLIAVLLILIGGGVILYLALAGLAIIYSMGANESPKGRRIFFATYITQNPHGTKRWCPSKNLQKPPEPSRSYSKFRKAGVERMAKDFEELKAQMEKAYPGYKFLDAEVKYNGINAAFYIYARMVKAGAKGARQRK